MNNQNIIDHVNGCEASGVTGKELGAELGITTRAANKLATNLEARGLLVNTGWCRTSGRNWEPTEASEMKKVPGASIIWTTPNHLHFHQGMS